MYICVIKLNSNFMPLIYSFDEFALTHEAWLDLFSLQASYSGVNWQFQASSQLKIKPPLKILFRVPSLLGSRI